MKQIVIDVLDNGEIKIETRGYIGKSCIEETEVIKNILGNEITRQLTPAYYTQGKETVKKHLPLCG
jgi:hypothetical protein